MPIPAISRVAARVVSKHSLRTVLIVPFVVQIVGTVGLVGYLSFKSGQKSVENLAQQLMAQVGERVSDRLTTYLQAPQTAVAANHFAVKQGILDINDFEQLQQQLWQQLTLNPSLEELFFGNESGEEIGYGRFQSEELVKTAEKLAGEDLSVGTPFFHILRNTDPGKRKYYLVDSKGNPRKILYTFEVDNRTTPWFRAAKASKKQTWSPINVFKVVPLLGTCAVTPIYDTAGKWQGVFASTFTLSAPSTFLNQLNFSPSGQLFIMERSGKLVATSTQESLLVKPVKGEPKQLLAVNSKDTLTREIARQLNQKFDNFRTLQETKQLNLVSNHERQFVRVTPYRDKYGLDWLVVVVVPESDFMEQINANSRTTILLCIAALIGSSAIGILLLRWITTPIMQLNNAAKDIAKGKWEKTVNANRSDEVGQLSQSFNQMAAQLQQYFTQLQASNKSLAESESKLRQILEAMPVGVTVHDATGQAIYTNPTAKQLLGIETVPDAKTEQLAQAYQLYRIGTEQLYPIEHLPVVRSLQGERVRVDDIEIRLPDRRIPGEVYSAPLFDETGNIVAAIAAFFDITERQQAQKILADYNRTLEIRVAEQTSELYSAKERLQYLLTTSPAVIFCCQPGGNWAATFMSENVTDILGYEAQEFLDEPDFWASHVHPDDINRILVNLASLFEQRFYIHEYRFLHADGTYRWLYAQLRLILDAIGNPSECVGYWVDISDRKKAEETLREREEQLQLALEGSGDGLWDWNMQTGELYLSPRWIEMLGYKAEELSQELSTWERLIHPDDKPWVMETLNAHLADSSVPYKFEYRVLTKSGEWKWIANYGKVVARDENGAPLRMTGTHRDISDKKLAEIKLQQAVLSAEAANRAKSAFLANMSHELRTPLNGILGYAQILVADTNCTPKQKKGVGIIYKCGTHLLTLISDILDLSKIEAGKLELYPENVDFLCFLTDITEIFRLKAIQKALSFTYLPLNQLPSVIQADEKRLRQVLMNLLSNAVKFTDTGNITFKVGLATDDFQVSQDGILDRGEVTDELRIDSDTLPVPDYPSATPTKPNRLTPNHDKPSVAKIRFQVEDTGIGISSEQIEKIFLPFEQVRDSSRRTEGTGLGLAITQKIVAIMGGKIFVESTPQAGSKFWFDLEVPVVSTPIKSTPVKTTDTIIGYSGAKQKVLIVDDRWENCAVLINILEPIGFEVEQAVNGQEGLQKAWKFQPDLILVDLVMPVMDGYQMTQQLRQFPEFQNTSIIAISANAFAVDRLQSLEAGCNDFLPKPIQAEDLFDKLKSYLNLSWLYDSQSETKSQLQGDELSPYFQTSAAEMVIPPKEKLLALYGAANTGYVQGVEEELIAIEQLNPDYSPFVTRMLELAADFEYEKIANFIDGYSSDSSD